jgi:hypothetical protein
MKKVFWINTIVFTSILLLIACKKEEPSSAKEYAHWPAVKTLVATNVDSTTAKLNGTVNGYGLSTTVIFEYGTTTDYGSSVTAFQSPVTGDSIEYVSADISGLTPCTTYHFRVKAENSKWINFNGSDSTFISLISVITVEVTNITDSSAVAIGYIACHEGEITERGFDVFTRPIIRKVKDNNGTGIGYFQFNLTGLLPSRNYLVQAYAVNSKGTVSGNMISFKTLP